MESWFSGHICTTDKLHSPNWTNVNSRDCGKRSFFAAKIDDLEVFKLGKGAKSCHVLDRESAVLHIDACARKSRQSTKKLGISYFLTNEDTHAVGPWKVMIDAKAEGT
jgi:hypothetical protein